MAESVQDVSPTADEPRGGDFLFAPVGSAPFMTPERFSEEQRQFFATGADFVNREVLPAAGRIEQKDNALLRQLLLKAGELGLLGVDVAEDLGGLGLDKTTSMLVAESQAGYGSWATTFGAHTGIGTLPIVFFGTPEQKAKYLPDLASGRKVAAYALSEAGSGSDALGAKTVARLSPDGKHYLVNGGKMWITNGGFADVYVVFLKIDGTKFTAMIVERGTPGFTQGREEHKLGIRGSSTTPLIFEDCKVPAGNVLGEIGKGHKIAFNILNVGRLKLAAFGVGGMKYVLKDGVEYAAQRKQFGRAIADFGLVREKLARAAAQIYAAEAMTYRAAGAIDAAIAQSDGSPGKVMEAIEEYAIEASIMKVTGSEWLFQIIDEVLQIHGGNGFVEDYPIERAYRDNRVNRIFEGTNEINRLLIPGMIFKRAVKGAIPLMAAVQQLDEELIDPRHLPPYASAFGPGAGKAVTLLPVGRLGAERRGAEMAKRQFIFAAKWAASLGTALEERQEVLAALADVAIEVYAMDSVLGRTLATGGAGFAGDGPQPEADGDRAQLRDALCRFYCMEGRERAFDRARTALAAVVPPGELDAQLEQLARLHKYTPVNSAEAREAIVPSLLEAAGYPLSY
ncbi:MAG TPA: acyl-CoA dehydrogenase family protein [Myxococcales bacterium]|jgi:alkylation response protein AidB-like acyl-CoA dehydrogenase|nr:acyl-CoA dehydrogenase family protein [Myxococcales bacterium]